MKKCRGSKGNPCVVGDVEQPLSEFYKQARNKDGHWHTCKSCDRERLRESYQKDRDRILEKTKAYGKANRHITRKASKKYYYKNREAAIQRKLDWCKNNPEKAAATAAEYRARKNKATPAWLSEEHKEQILTVYEHARECEVLTGDKYHVDHIVPLKGENISGLHVPWNLQVLPADLNIAKSNSHG